MIIITEQTFSNLKLNTEAVFYNIYLTFEKKISYYI